MHHGFSTTARSNITITGCLLRWTFGYLLTLLKEQHPGTNGKRYEPMLSLAVHGASLDPTTQHVRVFLVAEGVINQRMPQCDPMKSEFLSTTDCT